MNFITKHRIINGLQALFGLLSMPTIIYLMYSYAGGLPENGSGVILGDIRVLIGVLSLGCLIVFGFSIKEVFKSKEKIISSQREILVNRRNRFSETLTKYDDDIKKFDEKVNKIT